MSIKIYVKYVKNNRDFHTTKLNLPTGALDQKTGHEVLELLKEINKSGKTVIIVTHDEGIAKMTDRIITISDGRIVSDNKNI